jgi:transcriptional accessory protein Tex/SPT6
MANVEDENTLAAGVGAGVAIPDRHERDRADRGGLKARPRDDDDQIDPVEYARLLDVYDNSFRNIAEGEVVKGTVLKVTPSEVIVDVGYKSEGIIGVGEFLDENGELTVQPGDIVDVLLERTEGTRSRRPTRIARSSSAASSNASKADSRSTSVCARSCRARRSTSVPSATSTRSAVRNCECASSR